MAKTPTQLRSEAACKTVLKNLERRGFEAFYCSDKPAALYILSWIFCLKE